jgi:hypothetical protein
MITSLQQLMQSGTQFTETTRTLLARRHSLLKPGILTGETVISQCMNLSALVLNASD